jgi:CRISPR-associated endoribonuclease Cas6
MRFRFQLKVKNELSLPSYKGSTLRGGFGIAFRRINCVNRKVDNCHACTLKNKCVYAYVFETSPHENSQKLKNLREIPRPFVIEPPQETKRFYHQGELLEFNLVLIGKAIDYLPYFIYTFRELGQKGIGKGRGKYELYRVYDSSSKSIYDCESDTIRNISSKGIFEKMDSFEHNGSLSLSFITPTRIKFEKDLVVKPEFHILLRSLLHRLSALSYFHCGMELKVDYEELIYEASRVKTKDSNLKWVDWERYSSRQDSRMKLGGFVGDITYNGEIKSFLPLLLLGQATHIGKSTTFGLGKYEIVRK